MKPTLLGCLALFLFLAACGGDSGGDGALVNNPPPPADLMISGANAAGAAGVSYRSATRSADMSGLVADSGFGGGAAAAAKPAGAGRLGGFLVGALAKIPFGPSTFPCDVSGSMTISGDLGDPTGLTAGDFFTVVADNCDDGLGEVVDGTLDFVVDAISGDFLGGLYRLTMSINLTDFQVASVEDVVTGNGDITVTLDTTGLPVVTAAVSGNALTIDANAGSDTLSGFASSQTVDTGVAELPYTFDASGTVDSTELTGVVTYSTPVVFQGNGSAFPYAGEFLVRGSGNSSARLVVLDDVNVRIEVDSNGDGTVDETIETTWEALTAGA